MSFEPAPRLTCDLSTCNLRGAIEPTRLHNKAGEACSRALVSFGSLRLRSSGSTLNAAWEANLVVDAQGHGHIALLGDETDPARVATASPGGVIELGVALDIESGAVRGAVSAARKPPDAAPSTAPRVQPLSPLWTASWRSGAVD